MFGLCKSGWLKLLAPCETFFRCEIYNYFDSKLQKYMAPGAKLVGEDIANEADAANNYRIYGTFLLLVLFFCVFLGMRFVSIVAAVSLSCVILSILSIYIGIFASGHTKSIE